MNINLALLRKIVVTPFPMQLPMIEIAQGLPASYNESAEIARLQSQDAGARQEAAKMLMKKGGPAAADKIEGRLLANGLSFAVKKSMVAVLAELTMKDVKSFAQGPEAVQKKLRRMQALSMGTRLM
jgi:hypothetical protein